MANSESQEKKDLLPSESIEPILLMTSNGASLCLRCTACQNVSDMPNLSEIAWVMVPNRVAEIMDEYRG